MTDKFVAKCCPDFFMLFFHHFTEISLAKKEKKKKEVIYVAKMMGKILNNVLRLICRSHVKNEGN